VPVKYIVKICDVVESRQLADRELFQRKLAKVLTETSRGSRGLASQYTITLGDEFQAVYRTADSLIADHIAIMAEIHPVRIRVSIGVGNLTTRVNPKQAIGMDGPAFYSAREALVALKKTPDLMRISGDSKGTWTLANSTLNLITRRIRGWARNRLLVLTALLRDEGVSEIAAKLQISRVAVYKNIKLASLDEIVGICGELTRMLNETLHQK
jgi:hypothetical protein